MSRLYSRYFFDAMAAGSCRSAKTIVPLMVDIVKPRSVIDIGCGTGGWLREFENNGIADYLGIDGPWIASDQLQIPLERFRTFDLSQPISIGRKFDLAVSLEVAEHLPRSAAETFIATLTSLAPVVAFSAAIPFQGGTDHINEEWQSAWERRFAAHDFKPIDLIRPRVWNDSSVEFWYAQNLIMYAQREWARELSRGASCMETLPISVVHPMMYLARVPGAHRLRENARILATALIDGVRSYGRTLLGEPRKGRARQKSLEEWR